MTAAARIAIILPRKEPFARDHFGAIALTVEAYLRASRYCDVTEVLAMPVAQPRDADRFRAVTPRDAWWRRRNLGFAAGCADYLQAMRPRHIEVHNRVEVFAYLKRRFPEAAVSLWLHNDPQATRGARRPPQRQAILDRAAAVVCVSGWVRSRFLAGVAGAADRAMVLPPTFDVAASLPAAKEKAILYVGRIVPEKGVLPLAEALANSVRELPGWRCRIVGTGRKPNYVRQVAAALAPLGERATMAGFLPHEGVMAELARAAIAVVPSQWDEPFGRTALEAMAAGCAVIASRRGGLPEIVGDAGLLIEEPDRAVLAEAITALARDDARRAELQRRGRARAVAEFDIRRWSAMLDDWRLALDPGLAAR